MTNDEKLNILERNAKSPLPGQEQEAETLLWLIALARIGAAVTPRPISEAPKDDTVLVYIQAGPHNSTYKQGTQAGWREHYINTDGEVCETSDWNLLIGGKSGAWEGTHFIPLSALPQVEL